LRTVVNGTYYVNAIDKTKNVYVRGKWAYHGASLKECIKGVEQKIIKSLGFVEACKKFMKRFPKLNQQYSVGVLQEWHNILTNSCEPGRKGFLKLHDKKLTDRVTLQTFFDTTKGAWGGDKIAELEKMYKGGNK
jgi:hypothetical protein